MTTQINPATQVANGTLPAGVIVTTATNATNAVSLNGIGAAAAFDARYLPIRTPSVTPVPVTAGVGVSASHGLAYVPLYATLEYVNLTAEQGYSIGDVTECFAQWNGTVVDPLQPQKTSTIVSVIPEAGLTMALTNKVTGAFFTPTAANWAYRFVVR